ncbi:hypothetical protein Syun_015673 [Stephania yunnanensis]|uniref:GATA-type domain-containing protein n=1 Tax=Stephania yunnanensis TaxID=152371 RepID=A0AAP0P9K3_9MAGN
MMNRCGSTNTHQYGASMGSSTCSCNNSFSYYSTFNDVQHHHHHHECCSTTNTTVDCTLSLGTPSTRHSENINNKHSKKWSGSSFMSTICNWGSNKHHQQQPQQSSAVVNNNIANNNGDPLLARRCANCDTTSTPLWRNGPRGPKSLCNACGIRYKKEERRATAAANVSSSNVGAHAQGIIDSQNLISSTHQYHHHNQYSWAHNGSTNEFTFGDQYRGDHESSGSSGVSFLSWHLSVPERPGLVQYDYS